MPKEKDEKSPEIPETDPELSQPSSFNRPLEDAKRSDDSSIRINKAEETSSEENDENPPIIPDPDPELSQTVSYNRPLEDAKKSDDSSIRINKAEETSSDKKTDTED